MKDIKDAIERIKKIECPTGEISNRVIGVLTDYEIAGRSEISVSRDLSLDRNGAQGFNAKISRDRGLNIAVLAVSGRDDYVAKVIDAFIS